jgi:hypothetical protein
MSYVLSPNTCTVLGICLFGFDALLSDWWDSGIDIGSRNGGGDSFLHLAVVGENRGTVLRLLDRGFDSNTSGSVRSGSALTVAAGLGGAGMMRTLISAHLARQSTGAELR